MNFTVFYFLFFINLQFIFAMYIFHAISIKKPGFYRAFFLSE
jgi:hypothetical protein